MPEPHPRTELGQLRPPPPVPRPGHRSRAAPRPAAAFLERAALLTADPARRAGRTLAAAQASLRAGAFGKALELLATAEAGPLDEVQGARADWLRGQIAFASGPGSDAPPLLLKAARRLEPLDPGLARETYLDAWQAALFAGHLASGGDLEEVSRAARTLPPPERPPRAAGLLLDGLALLVTDGPAAAAPVLRQAISTFAGPDVPVAERLRWSWMAPVASLPLWDVEGWRLIMPPLQLARDVGALDQARRQRHGGPDRTGGADRPAGRRRAVEPGDRHPPIPVPAHGPVSSGQGLRQAGHHLAHPAQPRPIWPFRPYVPASLPPELPLAANAGRLADSGPAAEQDDGGVNARQKEL